MCLGYWFQFLKAQINIIKGAISKSPIIAEDINTSPSETDIIRQNIKKPMKKNTESSFELDLIDKHTTLQKAVHEKIFFSSMNIY